MTWKAPETEEAWQECLSAYLDGELPPDERRALETWLATDARRTAQLKELQSVSRALREWPVEAPAPDPNWTLALSAAAAANSERPATAGRPSRLAWGGRGLRWALQGALFMLGVLVGVVGMQLRPHDRLLTPPPAGREIASAPHEGLGIAISPRQSEQLTREVKAGGLRDTVLQGLDKQDWMAARQALDTLRNQYPDSQALRELEKNKSLRRLENQLAIVERI